MTLQQKKLTYSMIKFNNVYQELESDPDISRLRTAAVDYVLDHLRRRVEQQILEAGIIPELEQAFLQRVPTATARIILLVETKFSLSGQSCKDFRYRAEIEPMSAMQYLRDTLLDKQKIAVYKDKPLSAAVWHNFINIRRRTSDQNLIRIAESIGLTQDQTQELLALRIPDTFTGLDRLWEDMIDYRQRNPLPWVEFFDETHISKDTWYKFRSPDTVASQNTLLKLTIALMLTEAEGWDFLGTVDSSFVTLQDLVILTCLKCSRDDASFHSPGVVDDILEYYAVKYPHKSISNIYHQHRKDYNTNW